jgi:arylsulfatase A
MLLTGKYNFRNYSIWGIMDTSQRTIGNMLKDAGYATCYAVNGNWMEAMRLYAKFGFDRYSVWLPFKICPEEAEGSRYKSAKMYQDGGYLPQEFTDNKYSEICYLIMFSISWIVTKQNLSLFITL